MEAVLTDQKTEQNSLNWVVATDGSGNGDAASLTERVQQAVTLESFLPMDVEASQLHERAIAVFMEMEENPDTLPILVGYCEALESADMRPVLSLLAPVEGAEQVAVVAKGNFIRQADRLLLGARDILEKGSAVVTNFGTPRKINSLDEIATGLEEIRKDMVTVRELIEGKISDTESDVLMPMVLAKLEKYMFDGRGLEKELHDSSGTVVMVKEGEDGFVERLQSEGVLPKDEVVAVEYFPRDRTSDGLLHRIALANEEDRETDNIFLKMGKIPKTVIIHVPSQDSFTAVKGDHYAYQIMFVDWFRLPVEDRPQMIMFTDGFEPRIFYKGNYPGFLFCKTPDELRNLLTLSEQLAQNKQEEIYETDKLEKGQKEAYDNSRLREWEGKTADTYQSLKHIVERIRGRRGRMLNVLDLGTGEGRIAGMLARMGLNVMGLDISQTQLERSRTRIVEEGQGLRGEKETPGLSYHALRQLQEEGLVSSIELSDEEIEKRFLTVQGSFFELDYVLSQALIDWHQNFPDVNIYDFFDLSPYLTEDPFSERRDMFGSVGFDMAMFNWHTFCEIGSLENQKNVLTRILNVLEPGGELVIEIPDRKFEPYASALRAYHEAHPDEPYGTIRDPKPDDFQGLEGEDLYPPRYFPDINELLLLLKSVGFEVDMEGGDVQSYLIEDTSATSGKRSLTLKEYFITVRKSGIGGL